MSEGGGNKETLMQTEEHAKLLSHGIAAAESGQMTTAQAYLEQAANIHQSPELMSYLAYSLALGQKQLQKALALNRKALDLEPNNSLHFLIMGRILLFAGHREKAIRAFRRGLRTSPNQKIIAELKKLGLRKTPVFESLDRGHFINRFSGKILSRLGIR